MRATERQALATIAGARLTTKEDVREKVVTPLLELLGYQTGSFERDGHDDRIVVSAAGNPLFLIAIRPPAAKLGESTLRELRARATRLGAQTTLAMATDGERFDLSVPLRRATSVSFRRFELAAWYERLLLLLGRDHLATSEGGVHVVREVSSGGVGTVYEAWNVTLRRREALKIFSNAVGPAEWRRFRQGLRAQANLHHADIAPLYSVRHLGDRLAAAMYFSSGVPLDHWIDKERPPLAEQILLLARAAAAVHFAHEQGVVHRDLKPSNILVERDSDGWKPMIVDFDTAVVVDASTLTSSARRMGTIGYIDPDLLLPGKEAVNPRDPLADIYALGATFEFILTGAPPSLRRDLRELEPAVRNRDDLSFGARRNALFIIIAATSERRHRYTSAALLARDLRNLVVSEQFTDSGTLEKSLLQENELVTATFTEFDTSVATALPEFAGEVSDERVGQLGREAEIDELGSIGILYDFDAHCFYAGIYIPDPEPFDDFLKGPATTFLKQRLGEALRIDPITQTEDGAVSLEWPLHAIYAQPPAAMAAILIDALRLFFEALRLR